MRKAQAKKLPLAPDPRFNDKLVTRFVNNLMWQGKKSTAFDIFYDAVEKVNKQTGEDGYEVWKKALANVTPGSGGSKPSYWWSYLPDPCPKCARTEKFL